MKVLQYCESPIIAEVFRFTGGSYYAPPESWSIERIDIGTYADALEVHDYIEDIWEGVGVDIEVMWFHEYWGWCYIPVSDEWLASQVKR